jgi:hypothetical protein
MVRTLILAVAVLAAPLTLTPTAQATGCADYIKVCARPGPTATGGGGDSPFYAPRIDKVTHKPVGPARCTSGCDNE